MGNGRDGTPRGRGRRAWRWIAAAAAALALPVAGAVPADAVDGVLYNPGNGHFYKWVPGSGTWPVANAGAQALGGYLATVTSAQEKDWILANMGIGTASAWLGGTDAATEGVWTWITGETWSYTNWNTGEPNNSGNEDQLMMYGNGTWNDAPATYTLPANPGGGYLVEWDTDPNPPPPPQIPADPTNLDASLTAGGTALVVWTDNSTNEGSFLLERKVGTGAFETLTTLPPNSKQHEDESLVPLTQYTYRVRAQNAVGPSGWSNEDSVTSGAFAPAPAAPSNFVVVSADARGADLQWQDNSAGETAFEIRRRTGSGAYAFLANLPQDSTAFHDPGLSPDTDYGWQIRAVGTQRTSGAVETSIRTDATLVVTPIKGDIKDGPKFGKDSIKVSAGFEPAEGAAGEGPDPVLEGVTVRVGAEASPLTLVLPAGADGWTLKRTKWTWKSPAGSVTRLTLQWDTAASTLSVTVKGLELPSAPANPIRVSLVVGDEAGTDVRYWALGKKAGQFRLR